MQAHVQAEAAAVTLSAAAAAATAASDNSEGQFCQGTASHVKSHLPHGTHGTHGTTMQAAFASAVLFCQQPLSYCLHVALRTLSLCCVS
jgi:hypothetical protein